MTEAHLRQFLEKVSQLNAFVALSESSPPLRNALRNCNHHHEVVELARSVGFEIGRRWGETEIEQLDGEEMVVGGDANLLAGPAPQAGEESVETLLQAPGFRLERIHSCQAASPSGFWYDQDEHEWVCLLQGSARLLFADEAVPRRLERGDSLWIRAHRRHRVLATDGDSASVWLAIFWREDDRQCPAAD